MNMNMNINFNILHLFFLVNILSTSLLTFTIPKVTSISPVPAIPHSNITVPWEFFNKLAGSRSGDNKPGLARLKKYLHKFGYLPNQSDGNFTDDFDNALQSALRTYQLNFNLNSTGELDDRTLKQIILPRCGVADVVDGTTSMNSGKPPTGSRLGVVAHYSFFPDSPRWPENQTELSYAFLPGTQLDDVAKAVFATAFRRWSEVTPLTFNETYSILGADIKIGFFRGNHGDKEPFDGVLGTLAHAFSPPDGRFHLDGDENWVINGQVLRSEPESAVDLESVVVHEIGHLLGLGHSSLEEAIMYPTISSGMRKVELTGDDIEGVQALYGSNPNFTTNGLVKPTVQEKQANAASAALGPYLGQLLILAVGLVSASVF